MANHSNLSKGEYIKATKGALQILDLRCSYCNHLNVVYQKDEPGRLIRCYIDRIISPYISQPEHMTKNMLPHLSCLKCGKLLGIPMLYEKEKRLAYRMVPGAFVQEPHVGDV